MDEEDKIEAWAVLDMGGCALHSVHIFKEDAEKAAWGLGSVVKLVLESDINKPLPKADECPK